MPANAAPSLQLCLSKYPGPNIMIGHLQVNEERLLHPS